MRARSTLLWAGILSAVVAITACSDSSDPATNGRLDVAITDAPFPSGVITSAVIVVERVEAHMAGNGGFARVDSFSTPQRFDLLQLTNGVTRALVDSELLSGKVTQLRLYISAAEATLSDGTVIPISIPSAAQTGIKVNLTPPADIVIGFTTKLLLDIDVSRSFKPQGNPNLAGQPGVYDHPSEIRSIKFTPTIRAVNRSDEGRVTGTVYDGKGTVDTADDTLVPRATVRIFQSGVEVTSTIAGDDGRYMLIGLSGGNYTLVGEAAGLTEDSVGVTVIDSEVVVEDLYLTP